MKLAELTALYSDLDIEYNQAMSGPYLDFSYRSPQCEIIAGSKGGQLNGFWRPIVAVGNEKALRKQCDRLWFFSQEWTYMDFLINGELSVVSKFLLKKGYVARPIYTQIIDLSKTEEELHANLRKSYKSLVNKTDEFYASLAACRELYQGHRQDPTWEIQAKMMKANQAFCVADTRAYALVYYNEYCAYYASGRGKGGAHVVVWEAILEAKRLGCRFIELGEQVFSGDEKKVNISSFKRGFGGKTVTRLLLEKL